MECRVFDTYFSVRLSDIIKRNPVTCANKSGRESCTLHADMDRITAAAKPPWQVGIRTASPGPEQVHPYFLKTLFETGTNIATLLYG